MIHTHKLFSRVILATVLSSLSCAMFPRVAKSSLNEDSNGNFGLELHYFESAYQCGASEIDIDVKVFRNGQLIQTMVRGDRLLLTDVDSIDELNFEFNSTECVFGANIRQLLGPQDPIPDLPGAYSQTSLQDMVDNLDSYEELYLVELGTTNPSKSIYDLQDIVLVVDNNPNSAPTANSDSATTTIGQSVIIDVLANDTDPENNNITISEVSNVIGGAAKIENNQILYTANLIPGIYSLNYSVTDEYGGTDIGTVSILVDANAD